MIRPQHIPRLLRTNNRGNKTCCLRLFLTLLLALQLLTDAAPAIARLKDVTLRESLRALQSVKGVSEREVLANLTALDNLNYTEKLVFQTLCSLPALNAADLPEVISLAIQYPIRFSLLELLRYFVTLPDCDLKLCSQLLQRLTDTTFVQERTLSSLVKSKPPDCMTLLKAIELVLPMEETGLWCARQLFELGPADQSVILGALQQLSAMSDPQQRAAEKYLSRSKPNLSVIPSVLQALVQLEESEAYNVRALFSTDASVEPKNKDLWLRGFFLLPAKEREQAGAALPADKRRELLHIYNSAARHIIWKINSLHSVTDRLGREIGTYGLKNMKEEDFLKLFSILHPEAREKYQDSFSKATRNGERDQAVLLLKDATTLARHATARGLTTSNIYILLANGGELYDSSFRDVLVPVFMEKLRRSYNANLLKFLQAVDENAEFVSDFITNLAQKGKLTDILPADIEAQKKLIDLVAESALHNENSLILFSATFSKLLHDLGREARGHLLNHLFRAVESKDRLFARQVQVILQYYRHKLPGLLTSAELVRIEQILARRGEINLASYSTTPFPEWLADAHLRSLSSFPKDDDGWASYISNCLELLKNGYKPSLAADYRISPLSETGIDELASLIKSIPQAPTKNLSALFRQAGTIGFVVDWNKKIGGTTITHSVYIFSGKKNQEKLLEHFLTNMDEMFVQRGHSYYRNTHLLNPLSALLSAGRISDNVLQAKQRFISLGSCGGIRAYTRLNELFRNKVDIFGTIGTGTTTINNPYNQKLFEIAAANPAMRSWEQVQRVISPLFTEKSGEDYILPGSLPAILHKMTERSPSTPEQEDDSGP